MGRHALGGCSGRFASSDATSAGGDVNGGVGRTEGSSEGKTHFGFQDVDVGEKKNLVRSVFSSVADDYDLMNDIMSGGVHRLWKDAFVETLAPRPSQHVLDVAGGTGDIAFRCADAGARVTVCDINPEMLRVGQERATTMLDTDEARSRVTWVEGDAEALPFDDNTFDAYTISFGIRNCTDLPRVLGEAHRVLKVGGRLMVLEFSQVTLPPVRKLYDEYSFKLIPLFGQYVAGDRDSYQYLVESIRRFPDQELFSMMIEDAGFSAVRHRNLLMGVAAIHSGFKL